MPKDIKIKLIYAYDGSKFHGSQSQPNVISVEDRLNEALGHVGIFERVISSSRTDKGVHALGQVSTCHCGDFWDLVKLKNFISTHAKPYIFIKNIEKVDEKFHPRFDAKARTYRYIISHDKFNPFLSDYVTFSEKIDLIKLNKILSNFVGIHDFSEFMKVGSDTKTSVREIYKSYAFSYKNHTIIKFKANGFLRSQVRLMVANALLCVKTDKSINFSKALTRIPAPSNGLYLERIFY